MALTTENAGAIIPGFKHNDQGRTVKAEMLVSTHVKSLGRVAKKGEIVEISADDSRKLFPWQKAKKHFEPVIEETVEEAEPEIEEVEAPVEESEEVEAPTRVKGKRKR